MSIVWTDCACRPALYGARGQVVSYTKCDACCEREFYRAVAASQPSIFGEEAGEDWPTEGTD